MTTTPKAARFRIRRTTPAAPPASPAPVVEDGFGSEPFPTAEQDMLVPPPDPAGGPVNPDQLTARQLRQVRRVAQKHGIETEDDREALRQMQAKGIDPFQKSELLELVNPAQPAGSGAA